MFLEYYSENSTNWLFFIHMRRKIVVIESGIFKWGALSFYLSTHSRLEDLSARFPVILLEKFNVIFIPCKVRGERLPLFYMSSAPSSPGSSSTEHIDLE